MDRERLAVIDNISLALEEGDSFKKVELFDPVITDEDVKRVIVPFDTTRKKLKNKLLSFIARKIAERETRKRNEKTVMIGIENALSVDGGAIITSNHFNFMDNTLIRLLADSCGKSKAFNIVVQESNIFMKGFFGFLMRNCNTLPVSRSASYMAKNLKPAIFELLSKKHFILIYPEQEMWYNYKKPRALRDGAYYYAAEFNVPIIPCFAEMRELTEIDELGFYELRHVLHIMPPIYPDLSLPKRERSLKMKEEDARLKRECYERVYGIPLDEKFIPERDIAGYRK